MANEPKQSSRKSRSKTKQLEKLTDLAPDERAEREPPKMQGQVYLKKRHAHRFTRSHEWFALLHAGILRLYKNQKSASSSSSLTPTYKVDLAALSALSVDVRQQRIVLNLTDESHYLWPVGKDHFDQWRDAIHKHRLYRQDLCHRGIEPKSDHVSLIQLRPIQSTSETVQSETSGATCNNREADQKQHVNSVRRSVDQTTSLQSSATQVIHMAANYTAQIQTAISDIRALQAQLRVIVTRIEAVAASLARTRRANRDDSCTEDDSSSEEFTDTAVFATPREQLSSSSVTVSMSLPSVPSSLTLKSSVSSKDSRVTAKRHIVVRPREKLPAVAPPSESISSKTLMSALFKRGLSLPISTYEPLSMLQVLCEELNYAKLLQRAAATVDPTARMADVAAFAVSAFACTVGRNRKPFNPLLGETYELDQVDDGWRFHAEQVSHHPPISACHADGCGWRWWQTYSSKAKQRLLSGAVEVQPESYVHVRLTERNEDYYWQKVPSVLHNVMSRPEERFVSHQGDMLIRCSSGFQCHLTFVKPLRGADRTSDVKGQVLDANGRPTARLEGGWDRGLYRLNGKGCETLSLFDKPSPDSHKYYGFSKFAIMLNELSEEQRATLPHTDSRFRPDQRLLEQGQLEEAALTKDSLEKKQRLRAEAKQFQQPMWFDEKQDKALDCKLWVTNNKYWPARLKRFTDIQFPPLW